MKPQLDTKTLILILTVLVFTTSASAYESQFTTSPPDTQSVGKEFTIAGEVSKSGYWESDLESIMIQSSPEGSSTWFVKEEKDHECFGASCSITVDSLSHDTAENVEYRIVAMNNVGNTVPYNPGPETVEFVEESTSVDISDIRSTDSNIEEGDSTRFKVDLRPNQDIGYLEVTFSSGGQELATEQVYNLDSGVQRTVSTDSISWNYLSSQLSTGQDHDLMVELNNQNIEASGTESDAFYLVEGEEEPDAELKSVSASDYQLSPGEETELRAEVENNLNEQAYVRVTWTADGTVLADKWGYISSDSTETITNDIGYYTIRGKGLSTGQDYDLEGRLRFNSVDERDTASDSLRLQEDEDFAIADYGPSGTVSSPVVLSVDLDSNPSTGWCKWEEGNSVGRDSSTLMAKPDSSVPEWRYDQDFSEGSHTVSFQCFNDDRSITGEETTTFTVEEDEDKVEIRDLKSTDTHIEEREETDFEAQIHANEDFGYLEVDFYVDGEKVRENNVALDSGETITVSDTFSWDDLQRDFETGQNHDLEVRLNSYQLDSAISQTEENEFYLAESDEETSCREFHSSDLDVDLVNFESIPVEGNNYDSSVELTNNGDTDVEGNLGLYIKESNDVPNCDFYDDHFSDLAGFTDGDLHADAGESDSFDFSYSGNPIDDLEYGETYHLVAVFDDDSTVYVGSAGAIKWERADDDGDDPTGDPDASFSWTPSQPQRDDTVTFDASGSSGPDSDIVEYKWYFGDGSSPGYGRTVQHSYDNIGEYDVQLVVEDSEGNTDSTTRTVPVVGDPEACSLRLGQIRFDDPVITRGDSTVGEITVSNLGEEQVVSVTFKEGSNVVDTQEVTIDANSQRTLSTTLGPEVDSIITAEIETSGEPCGNRNYDRHAELIVVEGSDQESTLDVNVRADDGRRLYNARVALTGEGTGTTRYTGASGAAYFELGEGDYDVVVSKTGYSTETRSVNLAAGEQRSITVTLDSRDGGQGTLVALVEDKEGNRLEDAQITVENGVDRHRETDSNGRTTIDLDPGTYTVTAEKTGYGRWTESVHINRGEQTVRVFRLTGDSDEGLNIADVNYPSSVCRGSTMTAEVEIDNNEGYHELVSLTGKGLGSINMIRSFSLDTGETVTKTLHFTNVQGTGTEEFTVTANNQDSDSVTRTVEVESCGVTGTGQASDISMQLDYTVQPNMAVYGDILKVNGFVDGTNGRTNVDIKVSGETKASVRTQPDGYYQTWITADEVGAHTVTAESGEVSASRPLRVIPTSQVTGIEAPVSAFEGQTFQVCAQVDSQIEPEVILERDGEVVTSKKANGRVCFERQARGPGTHAYRIAALTSGEGNSASTTVEVLEMDVEASSFPDQIASVESGSGLVKVELYNTNDNQTRYDLKLEGLPDTWASQSEKQVILDKGERRTVYFYLTPQEEGRYQPAISVRSRGEEIYWENLDVITGGTTDSNPGEGDRSFFGSFWRGMLSLFSP